MWVPTWKGLLVLLAVIVTGCWVTLREAQPFLAENAVTNSEVLVVEGWIPDYALKRALDLSNQGHAKHLVLTGGPVRGELHPEPGDHYAHLAMKRLQRLGLPAAQVHEVPTPASNGQPDRDRTYASAMATRDWLKQHQAGARSINILTMGVHARRSRLLFQKAVGPDVRVGVISIEDREYDPVHWWRYSEGVKEVISEGAAYLYARWLFFPD